MAPPASAGSPGPGPIVVGFPFRAGLARARRGFEAAHRSGRSGSRLTALSITVMPCLSIEDFKVLEINLERIALFSVSRKTRTPALGSSRLFLERSVPLEPFPPVISAGTGRPLMTAACLQPGVAGLGMFCEPVALRSAELGWPPMRPRVQHEQARLPHRAAGRLLLRPAAALALRLGMVQKWGPAGNTL